MMISKEGGGLSPRWLEGDCASDEGGEELAGVFLDGVDDVVGGSSDSHLVYLGGRFALLVFIKTHEVKGVLH